jgi:hypothetical protein
LEAKQEVQQYFACDDPEVPLENHLVMLGSDISSAIYESLH